MLIPANPGSDKPVISDIMWLNVLPAGYPTVNEINNFIIEQFVLGSHPDEHLFSLACHISFNWNVSVTGILTGMDQYQSAATFFIM